MYTSTNFKTKKALKEAVEKFNKGEGPGVEFYQPGGMFHTAGPPTLDGVVYLEGPHYPEPHKWYSKATAKDGFIVRVT